MGYEFVGQVLDEGQGEDQGRGQGSVQQGGTVSRDSVSSRLDYLDLNSNERQAFSSRPRSPLLQEGAVEVVEEGAFLSNLHRPGVCFGVDHHLYSPLLPSLSS